MSAFGTLTEFNPKGDWSSYKERLNNISEEEKKRAVFFWLWARKHMNLLKLKKTQRTCI